ncbi:MAG: MFS transporter [Pseudomonadota bacterium]
MGGELRYVAAFFGAHLSFIPLFALLLPRRVAAVAPDNAIVLLSLLLFAGGITASVVHIAAGRFSDRWLRRHDDRRGVIVIGAVALAAGQLMLAFATSETTLLVAIIAFQSGLNLMFAPLGALLADHVPDARKGRVAGWLNASLPLSSLGTTLAAFLFPSDGYGGFLLIAAIGGLAVLPLLVRWPFAPVAALRRISDENQRGGSPASAGQRADYIRLWTARLFIQLGAAFLINYFFLYLLERKSALTASQLMGSLAALATILSVASAISAGHWSDRSGQRRPTMIAAALACAAGLLGMAATELWPIVVAAFIMFHVGLTAFLSVDSAMVTQLLSTHGRRGELLGVMNLTNTIPSIVVPALTLLSVRSSAVPDWSIAFATAGALALAAAAILSRLRTIH